MRRTLERRLGVVGARLGRHADPRLLAFARAVVAFGGEADPGGRAAEGLARWLGERRRT